VSDAVVAAYSATGGAWESGPGRLYNRLAEVLVSSSPVPLAGRTVLDLGAGTGAASRAIAAAGGRALALDAAVGMLDVDRSARPPAMAADVRVLPVRDAAVDGVVAAFSLNHVDDPVAALRECRRVCAPGAPVVFSSYAVDEPHPVKAAVAGALAEHGFRLEPWADTLFRDVVPLLADPTRCLEMTVLAGLDAAARVVDVAFPELAPRDLVAWRLGMPQHAPFVATLPAPARDGVRARALERLGDAPPLVRRIIVVTAVV
jgi:SAM-dependent methyltransferase